VDPYGANIFLQSEVEQAKVTKTLDLAASAHLVWIKQDFVWSDIEINKKGDFQDIRNGANKSAWDKYDYIVDQAEQRGLKVVARVSFAPTWARAPGSHANDAPQNPGDLADFVDAMIGHYKGRIRYIQVWNEPNLAVEWKFGGKVDPAAYTQMLKTVYTKAKQADPSVVILSAPMAINNETIDYAGNDNELDYWAKMYEAGAKDYFDILSANAYGLDQPPDAPPSADTLNFRRVELLHDVMVQKGDTNKAVWFNEYGWNASPTTLTPAERNLWRRVDPAVQAQWTVDGINYAQAHWPWSGVFFIWYLRQVGDISPDKAEYYFAMVYPDFSQQQVYKSVRHAAGLYNGPGAPGGAAVPATTAPSGVATDTPAAGITAMPGGPTAPPGAGGAAATPTAIAATPVPTASPDSGVSSSTLLLIAGIVLVLLGLGAIGYFLLRTPTAKA